MADKSMSDALLNRDKDYRYGTILPMKYRESMDVDQLDTDYMRGDMSLAVPSIIADTYNSLIESGQMMMGDRELDPGKLFMNTLDFAPGALAVGRLAPVRGGTVLGANVFQGGPHRYGPEGAAKSLSHVSKDEGQTAYGWGRYDADLEGVARSYQNKAPKSRWDLPGHLYKHDLPDEDIARYLDWDKPLSEQPESVRKAFQKAFEDAGIPNAMNMNPDGESAYTWLAAAQSRGESVRDVVLKQRASEALGRAGIPGLKYKDAVSRNKPFKEIKDSFLTELPEDAGIDEIVELFGKGHFSPDNEEILKALADDDWLGFDSAAQAISAALGKNIDNWEHGTRLTKAIAKAREGGTRNYVTWDQGVLDRMKLLERNGKSMIDALR
jgi:hypothetical protein